MTQNQSLSILGQIAPANTGTAGQVLTSNGASNSYWSTISGVNTAAQYAWTNTHTFSNVVTHTANVSVNGAIIANGGAGTSGQVLTSSAGSNVYWSTISSGASVSVSATAPSSPSSGNLWWNSELGALFIYYTDADGSQWVAATPTIATGVATSNSSASIIYTYTTILGR